LPEEEDRQQEERQREQEHQQRPPRALAQVEGHAAEEDQRRRREDQRRAQVVGELERAADLRRVRVRHQLVEEHREQQVEAERGAEAAEHRQELPPGVLARRQRRRLEQLGDVPFVVLDDGEAAGDGEEEGVDHPHQGRQHERERELGGDPGLGAAHRGVAGDDGYVAPGQAEAQQQQQGHQEQEQRSTLVGVVYAFF